jgi:hypothetical protein
VKGTYPQVRILVPPRWIEEDVTGAHLVATTKTFLEKGISGADAFD